jgi:hypothetical protein
MKVCIGSCTFCPGLLASAARRGRRLLPCLVRLGAGDMLRIVHGGHTGARNHRKLLRLCNQMSVKIV